MENYIIKKVNKKSIFISVNLILAGVILTLILESVNINYFLEKFILFIGIVCFITGIIIMLFMNKGYYHNITGSKIKSKVLYFKAQDYNLLNEYLKKGDFSKISSIKDTDNSTIKIEFKYSSDKKFACYQIFKYEPFQYKAETELIVVSELLTGNLIEMLNN